MVDAPTTESSLRLERAEVSRILWAFGISIALHLLIFGGYEAGKQAGLWQRMRMPDWVRLPKMLGGILKTAQPKPPPPRELPLMFVDVNPAIATPDPPEKAKYYSDKNSVAANPEPKLNTDTP